MSARVYLLADFGKGPRQWGRPRTAATVDWAAEQVRKRGIRRLSGPARAWWLVEAESADAARRVIAGTDEGYQDAGGFRSIEGRILASGGAPR